MGWSSLDLHTPPDLGFGIPDATTAETINALRPLSSLPIRPMQPFILAANPDDSARALTCLTQAVYFEAATEPAEGQAAIAQVILNRLRHPGYPKSVCGVVFQGAARTTGCQFSFACDGALSRPPLSALWLQAEGVARRALAGFVVPEVGAATHYHATYVAPYWAPTLVKIARIGTHIFYRWTGPWGEPPAFQGTYAGAEAVLSPEVLGGFDPRTDGLTGPPPPPALRKVTLTLGGEARTYTFTDPAGDASAGLGVPGLLQAPRRKPTPEEIRRINESLATMEAGLVRGQEPARPPAGPNEP